MVLLRTAPRIHSNIILRYRIYLEQKPYAPTTINLRLAAVRRVACEAAVSGLLSPKLAAGMRRVKVVRRIGVRVGNWLSAEQGNGFILCRPRFGARREELRDRRHAESGVDCAAATTSMNCRLRRRACTPRW